MCPMAEITSCQLSFLPVQSDSYLSDVSCVLDIIAASGLEHCVGDMSTIIKGDKSEVIGLISAIYDAMTDKCSFVMNISLSNICGCSR